MVDATEKRKSWSYVSIHYRGFQNHSGWEHIIPFRVIVEQLLASSYPDQVYAITSHESLGFSLHGSYPERLDYPMVWITPLPNKVKVEYGRKQREKIEISHCSYDEAWEIIICMIERLIEVDAPRSEREQFAN